MTNKRMALAEPEKKGGPYTKDEQQKRRDEVFKLHFEHGYSALKISEMTKINRNTINEDIRHLYSEVAKGWDDTEKRSWAIKQLHRLETQRDRLLADLEKQEFPRERLNIEKMIFDIDNKITNIVINTIPYIDKRNESEEKEETVDESEIKEVIPHFLKPKNDLFDWSHTENEILHDIIKLKKCNISHAQAIFQSMVQLGLELCSDDPEYPTEYDMSEFSLLRGYISEKEFSQMQAKVRKKGKKKKEENLKHYKAFGAELIKKYGPDKEKWPDQIKDELKYSFHI